MRFFKIFLLSDMRSEVVHVSRKYSMLAEHARRILPQILRFQRHTDQPMDDEGGVRGCGAEKSLNSLPKSTNMRVCLGAVDTM